MRHKPIASSAERSGGGNRSLRKLLRGISPEAHHTGKAVSEASSQQARLNFLFRGADLCRVLLPGLAADPRHGCSGESHELALAPARQRQSRYRFRAKGHHLIATACRRRSDPHRQLRTAPRRHAGGWIRRTRQPVLHRSRHTAVAPRPVLDNGLRAGPGADR